MAPVKQVFSRADVSSTSPVEGTYREVSYCVTQRLPDAGVRRSRTECTLGRHYTSSTCSAVAYTVAYGSSADR